VELEPTMADWIVAVSAAGAFVAAVSAAVIAWGVAKRDRADRQRDQASKVAAWVARQQPEDSGQPIRLGGYAGVCFNASLLPVYDAVVTYELRAPHDFVEIDEPLRLGLLPPGEQTVGLPDSLIQRREELGDEWAMRLGISFTDAANHRWTRGTDGILKEAPLEYPDMSRLQRAWWRLTNRVPRPSVRPEELITHVTRCPPRT
jgi:hypothetical protein